jgi:SAM-dependent methyltransferase
MRTRASELIITQDWTALERTPKFDRMLRRRAKTLRHIEAYRRQCEFLDRLLGEAVGRDERVLEVACGTGFHLLELRNRGWSRLIGLEIDPNLCQLTSEASQRFAPGVVSIAGDACEIPLADASCAAVLSHSFFEHVYDVDAALREQVRVLRPGGRLLVFDGNLLNPRTLVDLLLFYPLRTRGRHGGLVWLFTKRRVHRNLYGYLKLGRDEDVKTPRWWRRRIEREPQLRLVRSVTGGHYTHPRLPPLLRLFLGSCVVVAEKR